jgi:hypothetical protein
MKQPGFLSSSEWDALLARIQSPSFELEASLAKSNASLTKALSGLDELESLTLKNLGPTPQAQIQSPSSSQGHVDVAQKSAPQPAEARDASAPQVKYQTSREEYAPALNQDTLVEALLQYQRNKALRAPKPAAPSKPRSSKEIEDSGPAFTRNDFTPMKIPAIEAEPKASPIGRSAAPGVRLPVLRLKPQSPFSENTSENSPEKLPEKFNEE